MGQNDATGIHGKLLSALERAPLEQVAWREVCDGLSDLVDGAGTALISLDPSGRQSGVPWSSSLDELSHAYIHEGWRDNDYRTRCIPKLMRRGWAVEQDVADQTVMSNHTYYNDFVGRYGFRWFIALAFGDGKQMYAATVQGRKYREPFQPSDAAALWPWRDRLNLALRQTRAAGYLRTRNAAGLNVLRQYRCLMLDAKGRPADPDAKAATLFGTVVRADAGVLRFFDKQADARFRILLDACRQVDFTPLARPFVANAISGAAVLVDIVPMPRDFQGLLSGCEIALLFRDLGFVESGSCSTLQKQYDLTAAEAQIALSLARAQTPSKIAALRRTSLDTVRTQIKSIYRKLDVTNQAELIVLFSKLGMVS